MRISKRPNFTIVLSIRVLQSSSLQTSVGTTSFSVDKVAATDCKFSSRRAAKTTLAPRLDSSLTHIYSIYSQGAPETGPIDGAPSRDFSLSIPDNELEYAPVVGLHELRDKVATYYNHLYRQGKESQYTAANVCIVPGGRAGITRIMSILGTVQVGYFTPDYTAYEQALGLYVRVSPTAYLHRDVNEALMPSGEFEFQTQGRGVGCVLLSNPCNPTGRVLLALLLRRRQRRPRRRRGRR
jgi:aspartate/methionine/tyrosine aminotransferase